MADARRGRIRTPLQRRVRLGRQRVLPALVWVAALAVLGVLAQRQTREIGAIGMVELHEVSVAPLADGTVHGLSVDLLDKVDAGQAVAMMDDTLMRAELVEAEAELSRLRAQLEADSERSSLYVADLKLESLDNQRRFALDEEEAQLDYLDRLVRQESDRISLEWLGIMSERQKALVDENIADESTYDKTWLRYKALEEELKENEAAIAGAKQRADEALNRRDERGREVFDVNLARMLQPLSESLKVQEARIHRVKERRAMLVLRAPVGGQVSSIFRRPGEMVLSGNPVLAISAAGSERVLAYVDESTATRIAPGSEVSVASRRDPTLMAKARLVKLGSHVEQFPLRLQRNPRIPEWGLPILVGELPKDVFYPGEVVHVSFLASTRN